MSDVYVSMRPIQVISMGYARVPQAKFDKARLPKLMTEILFHVMKEKYAEFNHVVRTYYYDYGYKIDSGGIDVVELRIYAEGDGGPFFFESTLLISDDKVRTTKSGIGHVQPVAEYSYDIQNPGFDLDGLISKVLRDVKESYENSYIFKNNLKPAKPEENQIEKWWDGINE